MFGTLSKQDPALCLEVYLKDIFNDKIIAI